MQLCNEGDNMQNNQKSFGRRGLPPLEAKADNPYTGQRMAVQGQQKFDAVTSVDENLRLFMLQVYNFMSAGLVITGLFAVATYWLTVTGDPAVAALRDDNTPAQMTDTEYLTDLGMLLWGTPLRYVVCLGPLLIILFTCGMWRHLPTKAAMVAFGILSALVGVSFSGLALTYTNGSISQMFFATAAAFGGLSLYGYTTAKDLSGWGSFLWMGLFGIIAASIFDIFWPSDSLHFAISVIGIIVFSGFTAYDTQMIKQAYSDELTPDDRTRLAIRGALDLYLDFINLFRFLLAVFGERE
jgi:uncharacterized protein